MYVHVSVITRYSNTVTFALNYFRINAERRLNGLASVEHWRNLARTGKVLNKYQTEVEVKLGRDTGIFYGKERTYEIETSGTVSRKISRASLSYQAFSPPSKPRGCAWKTHFFLFLILPTLRDHNTRGEESFRFLIRFLMTRDLELIDRSSTSGTKYLRNFVVFVILKFSKNSTQKLFEKLDFHSYFSLSLSLFKRQ